MNRADIFVYYDDVQFDKHGWRNRNRIKTPNGPLWLTAPVVRHKGNGNLLILDAEINNSSGWARKHIKSLKQYYAKAPFFETYMPELEDCLSRPWNRLMDLNVAVVEIMRKWMGIASPIEFSSRLNVHGDKSERLLNICKRFEGDKYISGDAAKDYLDVDLFRNNGVEVIWHGYKHPVYPQLHGEFIPYLSALDILFNVGDESLKIISGNEVLQ